MKKRVLFHFALEGNLGGKKISFEMLPVVNEWEPGRSEVRVRLWFHVRHLRVLCCHPARGHSPNVSRIRSSSPFPGREKSRVISLSLGSRSMARSHEAEQRSGVSKPQAEGPRVPVVAGVGGAADKLDANIIDI